MRRLLSLPPVYSFWSWLVGGTGGRARLVRDHFDLREQERVLDLGCGPAAILSDLGDVKYTGLDVHEPYIIAAREKFGSRGEFYCEPAGQLRPEWESGFDLVISVAVLHHLRDEEAHRLFAQAAAALKPDGRLVTVDACYHEGQAWLARKLADWDRGEHVRRYDAYGEIAGNHFDGVKSKVRQDLLRIPYSHLILTCRCPREI